MFLNAGSGSAYDVTLDDETWPEAKFSFKKGNGTGSWEKLVPQGSVSTSYVVTTTTPGIFVPPAAKVTYRDSSKPAPQVGGANLARSWHFAIEVLLTLSFH